MVPVALAVIIIMQVIDLIIDQTIEEKISTD